MPVETVDSEGNIKQVEEMINNPLLFSKTRYILSSSKAISTANFLLALITPVYHNF